MLLDHTTCKHHTTLDTTPQILTNQLKTASINTTHKRNVWIIELLQKLLLLIQNYNCPRLM